MRISQRTLELALLKHSFLLKCQFTISHEHNNSFNFKVHLDPKYFLRLNKSLHLFETHLPFFTLILTFLWAIKDTKSSHHLFHDRASKGHGSSPGFTSQTSSHACFQRLNAMQIDLWRKTRTRPMPLTGSVVEQMMARFCIFYSL